MDRAEGDTSDGGAPRGWYRAAQGLMLIAFAGFVAVTGWRILAPETPAPTRSVAAAAPRSEVRSPFAVTDGSDLEDAVSGVRLIGVRVSEDPSESGAVLALANGDERAVAVGQDLGFGVRVAEIAADHVRLVSREESIVLPLTGGTAPSPSAAPSSRRPER